MIGVDHGLDLVSAGTNHLKRDLLFLDELLLADADGLLNLWRNGPLVEKELASDAAADLEFLLSIGLIKNIPELPALDDISADEREMFAELLKNTDAYSPDHKYVVQGESGLFSWRRGNPVYGFMSRINSVVQSRKMGQSVVSCHPVPALSAGAGAMQGDVIQMVIARVPLPAENTPWQDILEVRDNKDLMIRAKRLARWSREVASQNLNLKDADDFISETLYEYETYMAAHKIKSEYASLTAVSVGIADVVEDICKLRFGKLVGRFASFKVQRADMILAEMAAPGRELSVVPAFKQQLRMM